MALDRDSQCAALHVEDFDIALPWLEAFSGKQVSELTLPDQRTLLHYACQHGRVDIAQQLITKWKCSIESKDVQGCTPLHTAAQYGQVETLKYLLHRLFNHEVSGLTVKLTPGGKLSHSLTSMFQQKLSDRHRDQSGNTPLHTACAHGHLDIVQLLTCKIGCDPNTIKGDGLSCLHLATQHGHLPLVRYLVEEVGSDMTRQDEHGKSPAYLAAERGNLDILKFFIEEKGADPQFKTSEVWKTAGLSTFNIAAIGAGRSLIHSASREGHLHVVRYLVEHHGCDPSCTDEEGITPLHLACQEGHMDIVSYLTTEARCDPNCTSEDGRTCLHAASGGGRLDVIEHLHIGHNCQIECDLDGRTPLHYAAAEGCVDVSTYLITDMKCNPSATDKIQRTPLHYSSKGGHLEMVKCFHRCDPSCKDGEGFTPLHFACHEGHVNVVSYLTTERHCNPLSFSEDGRTCLHMACCGGKVHVVKYLVDTLKCDPLHRSKQGSCFPLHFAAGFGHLEVVRYMTLTLNCDLMVTDLNDNTPLHYAAEHGHLDVIKFAIEGMNCDPNSEGQNSKSLLHVASEMGHLDVVKYLADTPRSNLLCLTKGRQTSLHKAVAHGHLEVVKYFAATLALDDSGYVLFTYTDISNNAPIHYAALNGHLEMTKFLTEFMECNPHCKGQAGRTPLHFACERGCLDVVSYLLDRHNCDLLYRDVNGHTPLDRAAAMGHLEVVRYCETKCTATNSLGLILAAMNGHLHVVKFFIEDRKYEPSIKHSSKRSLLHYASGNGHLDVVNYLVNTHNSDPLCPDEDGQTPLHRAAAEGHLEVLLYFSLDQASFLLKDSRDSTPLNCAISNGRLELVKYIVENYRLDPYLEPDMKKLIKAAGSSAVLDFMKTYTDPLHYAAITGDMESVKLYVERKKWCPNMFDRHGNNALHNAARCGKLEVVKYLTGFFESPETASSAILCDPTQKNKHGFTAQALATHEGHHHVFSYLLRATTNQQVSGKYAISPTIKIFVVGNSGSGKSTLVKSLSREGKRFGKFMKVKGVIASTAGIVPTTLCSQVFGKVNIYDFAGHEEYYASHEMILHHQTTQPLVLLAVDLSLSLQDIEKQLQYWTSLLSSKCDCKTFHLLVVGSHVDKVKDTEKIQLNEKVASMVRNVPAFKYHGFVYCDCRYPSSDNLNQLRRNLDSICWSIRLYITHHESDYSNRLCASLMHHLQQNRSGQVTIRVNELWEQIKRLKTPGPTLVQLVDLKLLIQTCKNLSSNGHLLFFPHKSNTKKSLLVLDEDAVLAKVHACLATIKKEIGNEIGMLEEMSLKSILSEALCHIMEPTLAIKYLLFAQFCTEIKPDHLLPASLLKGVVHYFFPNLVSATRPSDLLSGCHSYTQLYTWGLKCTNSSQFFTPRFLHTLFIQFVKCGEDKTSRENSIWKDGMLIVHANGTRSIIEVTDQTTRVCLAIQCLEGCESHLVKQRSVLISLIRSLVQKSCPAIEVGEFLLLPHNIYPPVGDTLEVQIAKVASSVITGLPTVPLKGHSINIPQHVPVKDLLLFDSFHDIKDLTLQGIFSHSMSTERVSSSTMRQVHIATKRCDELSKIFESETGTCGMREMTYSQIYHELSQYSIFTNENLYVSELPIKFSTNSHDTLTVTGVGWP